MKTFKHFINESLDDNAYIFDVDDTLVTTDAKILIKDEQGHLMRKLTPSEFNTYVKSPNEHVDLSEFTSKKIFDTTAKPTRFFKVIRNISNSIKRGESDSKIYILTARGPKVKDIIYHYLKRNGITVSPINIHTVGDIPRPVAELKKEVIKTIRNTHKGQVTFFDDAESNIALAKTVNGVTARLVTP